MYNESAPRAPATPPPPFPTSSIDGNERRPPRKTGWVDFTLDRSEPGRRGEGLINCAHYQPTISYFSRTRSFRVCSTPSLPHLPPRTDFILHLSLSRWLFLSLSDLCLDRSLYAYVVSRSFVKNPFHRLQAHRTYVIEHCRVSHLRETRRGRIVGSVSSKKQSKDDIDALAVTMKFICPFCELGDSCCMRCRMINKKKLS